MNRESQPNSQNSIYLGLYKALSERLPPKKSSSHLEDLVKALTDALELGAIHIELTNEAPPHELKAPGWPDAHRKALLTSGWLENEAPMVLKGNELSWRRWHDEMNMLIKELKDRSTLYGKETTNKDPKDDLSLIASLNNEQKIAVRAIEKESVVFLSGGPGTGKTSTVVNMLIKALRLNPTLSIALAAPTGKAARRLHDTLQKSLKTVPVPFKQSLTTLRCDTLHKLLKAGPNGFGFNKRHPLTIDLLVIDEMSMVDLALMRGVLDATPITSQLVLVGDSNQLPPVGSGAVWHELQKSEIRKHFKGGAINLNHIYRNRGELAALSEILRQEGISQFWEKASLISNSDNIKTNQSDLNFIPPQLIKDLKDYYKRLEILTNKLTSELSINNQTSKEPTTDFEFAASSLLDSLEQLMVLCPRRRGFWGIDHIHKTLLGQTLDEGIKNWPQGTPIMCGENQPELGLANGDIGLIVGKGKSKKLLFNVISADGILKTKLINPARLKSIEPAIALTIHKAQGSEANRVILLWPEEDTSGGNNSERLKYDKEYKKRLLYTAITRSRERLDLFTPKGTIN